MQSCTHSHREREGRQPKKMVRVISSQPSPSAARINTRLRFLSCAIMHSQPLPLHLNFFVAVAIVKGNKFQTNKKLANKKCSKQMTSKRWCVAVVVLYVPLNSRQSLYHSLDLGAWKCNFSVFSHSQNEKWYFPIVYFEKCEIPSESMLWTSVNWISVN